MCKTYQIQYGKIAKYKRLDIRGRCRKVNHWYVAQVLSRRLPIFLLVGKAQGKVRL